MKTITVIALLIAATSFEVAAQDTTLAIPGRPNSTPWLAASGTTVAVAWAATATGRMGDIFIAISQDGGTTFGAPVRVNSVDGEARINGEIAPRVTLSSRAGAPPLVTVTWNAMGPAAQIKTARSVDGGRTFGAAQTLQSDHATGERGWPASVVDARGAFHAIWLDHRAVSALYYRGPDGVERELHREVCYCCKTAMALGPKGEIYAAWRHVFAGNMRDMGFTVSRDGGRTFSALTRVNEDGWSIQGCPDDGPAMAVDGNGMIHLVWPTVQNEQGVILYATSTDGVTFTTPARLPNLGGRRPSHPQVAVGAGGRVMVGWDESASGVRTAAIAPANGSSAPIVLGPSSSYPMMTAIPGGFIVAWTSGPPDRSVIAVRRINQP